MLCAVRCAAEARELARDGNRRLTFPSVSDDLYYDTITQPNRAAEKGGKARKSLGNYACACEPPLLKRTIAHLELDLTATIQQQRPPETFYSSRELQNQLLWRTACASECEPKKTKTYSGAGVLTPINR